MAGAYNHNVQKMTEDFMEEVPGHHKLYVLGMVGRQYFGKRDVDMDGGFHYTVQKPTMHRARLITEEIVRAFLERELDEIHIVYTQMLNAMAMENVNMQLLPLKKADFKVGQTPGRYLSGGDRVISVCRCASGYYDPQLPYRCDLWMSCRGICQ